MVTLLSIIIRTYQQVRPAVLPNSCRFHPSCSDYALECLCRYGVIRGLPRAAWRIVRCSPLCKGGYDPVH